MCGIVGFISNNEEKTKIIKAMANKIKHRGPDGEGYYVSKDIALGHKRLAIIDISNGSQPMLDSNYVLVFNGEIYNYQELRKELEEDYNFKTNSDTEVILHGYKKWGSILPTKLRGMFAFAVWDKKNKLLFCARDHFGMKPFYYYHKDNTFMFASEIKAFLEHPNFVKEVNKEVLGLYLQFSFNPTSETFFKNVFSLLPGHTLTYQNGHLNIQKYFTMEFKENAKDYKTMIQNVQNVIGDSVSHHLLSDVPVGAFLSSGIDSSLVVSIAKVSHTYTIGYAEDKYNEINYAEDLTKKLNLNNYHKLITKEEYLKTLPKVLYHLDEPLSDPSIVPLYHLCALASRDVKVALGGEGSDEFFAGYNTYKTTTMCKLYYKIPFFLRRCLSKLFSLLPEFKGRNFIVRAGMTLEESYIGVDKIFSNKEIDKVLNYKSNIKKEDITKPIYQTYLGSSDLVKMQAIDINLWLQKDILLKGDKMSMASSLEVRCPFVDTKVFAVASEIPPQYKVTSHETKLVLREASKEVIPNDSYKKKKLGFPVPLRDWLKEDDFYNEIYTTFNKEYVNQFFNQKYILKLLKQNRHNHNDNYKKLWSIYTFLKWYEVFFLN